MSPSNNRKRIWPYVLLAALLILMGFYLRWPRVPGEVDRALTSATQIELYSLEGQYFEREWSAADLEKYERFYDWPVLGKTTIADSQTRSVLVDAFRTGVHDRSAGWAECFWPRHAIRVVHNGVTYDLLICFECTQYKWYKDGEEQDVRLIGDAPQPIFNKILEEAEVPLAKPLGESLTSAKLPVDP